MKIIIVCLLTILNLASCLSQDKRLIHNNKALDISTFTNNVDELVKSYQALDIFSGIVLIAQKGAPIYHKAYGLADREKNIKNTLNTKFDIGSMNKTFTKIVILQLVEEGKLKLSNRLSEVLPQFSDNVYTNINVSHLINHSSGFGDYYMTPGFFELPVEEKNIASLVKRIQKMPLLFEAGTEQEYSNSGYILLGAIIERITKKSYHQNVRERIVQPMNLKDTYVENKHEVPNRAIGYFKTIKGEIEDNNGFVEVPNPDGGFQSTAADVLKFYQEYHYGNNLLKEETKLQDEFYSMIQEHQNSGGAIPHAGGFDGANTVNYEILRDKISIVVMSNMNEPVAEQLGAGILAIIRGKEPQNPSLPAMENVYIAYNKHGIEYVKQNFEDLTVNFHPDDPRALILNSIGYEFLKENQVSEAIEMFKLNTELYPEDPNVWDSLGESFMANKDYKKAKNSYLKAIEIDPDFLSAVKALEKLKG